MGFLEFLMRSTSLHCHFAIHTRSRHVISAGHPSDGMSDRRCVITLGSNDHLNEGRDEVHQIAIAFTNGNPNHRLYRDTPRGKHGPDHPFTESSSSKVNVLQNLPRFVGAGFPRAFHYAATRWTTSRV